MIKRLHFTIPKYMEIVEAGVFEKGGERVELIKGEILEMNPIGPEHCELVKRLTEWSFDNIDRDRWGVWVQQPISLHDSDSVPEPDLAWVTNRSYSDGYPVGDQIALVIEVCYSTGSYDRGTKSDLYASAGIREYWIVDAVAATLEVRRSPSGSAYAQVELFGRDARIGPACQPDAVLNLSDLFSQT